MPITYFPLNVDVSQVVGKPVRRALLEVRTNLPDGTVLAYGESGQIAVPGGVYNLASGIGSLTLPTKTGLTNVGDYQYVITGVYHLDGVDPVKMDPIYIDAPTSTAAVNLADFIGVTSVPATFMGQAVAQLQAKVDEAEAIKQYVNDVSNIDTTVSAVDFALGQPGPAATLNAAIGDQVADPESPAGVALRDTIATEGAPRFVGKVTGLIGGDASPATKAANAAILEAATTPGSSVIIPRHPLGPAVPYYTNPVGLVGPVEIAGEDVTTQLRNDSGTVFTVQGTQVNVSKLYIRSDGGGPTITQTGQVDQCHWDRVKLWQSSPSRSIWDNAGQAFVDMRFSNFESWHVQTATVPGWNLVSVGGDINDNVWEKFRAQYSGNYHFWVETTSTNAQHGNKWNDATWEVCTGGLIRLISCRDYIIDNGRNWDMDSGLGGVVTMQRHGIYATANANNVPCIGTIRNQSRMAGKNAATIQDIKLPAGNRGDGTIVENCRNESSVDPYLIDLADNAVSVLLPMAAASSLTTLTGTAGAQIITKDGMTLPSGQSFRVGSDPLPKGFKVNVAADPGSIAANSALDVSLTVTGALAGDACAVSTGSALEAGIGIVGCWATADAVTFRLRNFTAAAIDPGIRTWRVAIQR